MIRSSDYYVDDISFSTVSYGAEAEQHFNSLSISKSIESTCEYTGGGKLTLRVGRSGEGTFLYVCDSNGDHCLFVDENEQVLASLACKFLEYRQSFVNSDPHSSDYFTPAVDAWEFAEKIEEEFGIEVQV
ncbi:hypothetical protein SH449x_002792 [Pirellulaceae bacterium SH449]